MISASTALTAACCDLAVNLAADESQLRGWWTDHQSAIRMLTPAERDGLIAAKDRRKKEISERLGRQA